MARPSSLVLSVSAALIMLGCSDKNNTPSSAVATEEAAAAANGAPPASATASGSTASLAVLSADLPLSASGSNPDWAIRIDPGAATVKGFDGSMAIYPVSKPQMTATSIQFSMGAGANSVTLSLQSGPCADTPLSTMNAAVRINGRASTGCAARTDTPSTTGQSPDWGTRLFDYVPGLQACLARGEADRAYADRVQRQADGSMSLLLHYADATMFTCALSVADQVSKFEAVTEAPQSSIQTPAFAKSAAAFATLGCEEAPSEVFGKTGEVLGYLQRGICVTAASSTTP